MTKLTVEFGITRKDGFEGCGRKEGEGVDGRGEGRLEGVTEVVSEAR